MSIFSRNRPNDVLLLMPVRLGSEKLPRGKIRMLYCDARGKAYAPIMSRSVYELARDSAEQMERRRRPFATLGLEKTPGNFIPAPVEIDTKEVWALEHILEHALKNGRLPDILKKYLKPIIKLGEARREAVLAEHGQRRRRATSAATPRVLDRLPYYPERDIEFSVPIYKAEYSYPLIVLKQLPSDKNTPRQAQLLILDSAGDMASTRVPPKLLDKLEKGLTGHRRKSDKNACALILKRSDRLDIDYMVISQAQRKALDTLTKYFEATGSGRQPVSAAARTVLAKARDRVTSPAK
ncbi:hypothetical protein ACFLX3_04425 [Chloroflexota bacterium]